MRSLEAPGREARRGGARGLVVMHRGWADDEEGARDGESDSINVAAASTRKGERERESVYTVKSPPEDGDAIKQKSAHTPPPLKRRRPRLPSHQTSNGRYFDPIKTH